MYTFLLVASCVLCYVFEITIQTKRTEKSENGKFSIGFKLENFVNNMKPLYELSLCKICTINVENGLAMR